MFKNILHKAINDAWIIIAKGKNDKEQVKDADDVEQQEQHYSSNPQTAELGKSTTMKSRKKKKRNFKPSSVVKFSKKYGKRSNSCKNKRRTIKKLKKKKTRFKGTLPRL